MRILIVGEEAAGIQMVRALSAGPHEIVAVMASPPAEDARTAGLWNAAQRMGIATWPAEAVRRPDLAARIREERVDLLLNVHSLYVVHAAVLEAPRWGSFNMHPGPLPRYAGLDAVSWAIYRGESQHGVTIHKMVSKIDAGPIVGQTLFPIGEDDSALAVSLRCVSEGLKLMLRLVDRMAVDPESIPYVAQDPAEREYFGRQVPQGGRLLWDRPAREIVDFVRACDFLPFQSPWGHPRTRFHEGEVAVLKARRTGHSATSAPGTVEARGDEGVEIAAADETVRVSRVEIGGATFDPSTRLRVGDRLGDEG